MISRFFKKRPKTPPPKKRSPAAPKAATMHPESKQKPTAFQKILTAEGWKRLMMKKYGKK